MRAASKLGEEEFDKALEKLEIHGGARVDFGGNVTRGQAGVEEDSTRSRRSIAREQFEKVLRFTYVEECRMAALVRHFGDEADASRSCGKCDVCDPAGAVLRLFRRATAAERQMAHAIVDELRPVDYKATGTLQRSIDPAGRVSRDDFDALLDAMVRARLIGIEEAEYEKDGEVRRFRKVRLTEAGLEVRASMAIPLLISDGVSEEFAVQTAMPRRSGKPEKRVAAGKPGVEAQGRLSVAGEALAARLKEWRTGEAKRLRVPPYCILHDRTLTAVALARPANPRELLEIDGIGPAKVEKFGAAILGLCCAGD